MGLIDKKRLVCSVTANCLIFILVVFAFVLMMQRAGSTALTARGLSSLKYFTTLSNIFAALVSVVYTVFLIFALKGRREGVPHALFILKLMSTAAVGVTFLVVIVFLGPLFGFASMYRGSNLWYHLIVPLICILDFAFIERIDKVSFRETLFCMVPVFIYGMGYLINILVNGVGEWPNRNDFYGFVLWGLPVGIAIFAGIMLIGWLWGIALRAGNLAGRKKGDMI